MIFLIFSKLNIFTYIWIKSRESISYEEEAFLSPSTDHTRTAEQTDESSATTLQNQFMQLEASEGLQDWMWGISWTSIRIFYFWWNN